MRHVTPKRLAGGPGPYDIPKPRWGAPGLDSETGETILHVNSANPGPVTYDPSGDGDVIEDSQNQYLYNADGRICAAYNKMTHAMVEYLYDADGNRWERAPSRASVATPSNGLTNSYVLGPG